MVFSTCESKVAFEFYRYEVYAFIADEFLLPEENISTDPVCNTSYRYLYSFLMVNIPSNTVETFTNNAPNTEKGI